MGLEARVHAGQEALRVTLVEFITVGGVQEDGRQEGAEVLGSDVAHGSAPADLAEHGTGEGVGRIQVGAGQVECHEAGQREGQPVGQDGGQLPVERVALSSDELEGGQRRLGQVDE